MNTEYAHHFLGSTKEYLNKRFHLTLLVMGAIITTFNVCPLLLHIKTY